jgi:glycine/D-amino acid oxidase-like deaminating enzyme
MADDQSDYGSTWYSGTTLLPPARTPLNYDLDVDICVIGGGLAGLTAAREAARRGWSVAVLEARRIAWNASGRNSGVVLPGYAAPVEKVVERIGAPAAAALWRLSQTGVRYILDTIAGMGDDTTGTSDPAGIIEGDGRLEVSKWPDADRILARIGLLQDMGIEVEGWQTERVRDTLRSRHYFEAMYFPGSFQINPLAYAHGLAEAAAQAGVRIYENTRVTAADLAGVRKRIDTPRARVRAGHVVLAGNVHLGGIARVLAATVVPVTAYTGVTRPLGKTLAQAIAFAGAVSDSRGSHHYRIVGGDRLMWTGSAAAGSIWARTALERSLHAAYPQLGPVRFERFWPGRTGFAVHGMPQIGEAERGVWLASAFGGHGLNTSALAGELVARGITERDDTWRRFLPFELVWSGGRAGRAVAYSARLWQRSSDAAFAAAARKREEWQRQRLEKMKAAGKSGKPGIASGKIPTLQDVRFPAVNVPAIDTLLGSGFDAMEAVKRRLKSSFAAADRGQPHSGPAPKD